MSIYHRYAVYYSVRRYLADVDKLCDLAIKCNIVKNEGNATTETLSEYKYIYEDRVLRAEPRPYEDDDDTYMNDVDETDPNFDKDNTYELALGQCLDKDEQDGLLILEDSDDEDTIDVMARGVKEIRLDGLDGEAGEASESGESGDGPDSGNETDPKESDSDQKFGSSIETLVTDGDAPMDKENEVPDTEAAPFGSISEAQLYRIVACGRVVFRINSALNRNICRVQSEQNNYADKAIQHRLSEAQRLNGKEKINSHRIQERELAKSWCEEDGFDSTNENTQNHSRAAAAHICRPSSPLRKIIDPDDLQWEDHVAQWRMDLGRLRDEVGRRFNKI